MIETKERKMLFDLIEEIKEHGIVLPDVENYDEEIVRLGELLGKQFSSATENTSKIAQELPFKREDYLDVFASEYEFLRKWYNKDYGL